MKKLAPLILLSAVLLYGCKTDFDIIAPYKEIIVIDGLLNAVDTVQSVKVGKAFLGEGNALIMAKQNDSINFGDILSVKMQRIKSNSVVDTFSLIRQVYTNKDTGIFAQEYVLYKTNHPILQDGSEYKIIVTDTKTGVSATSRTKIVNDMSVYIAGIDSINFTSTGSAPFNIIITFPGDNAYYFEMVIRFNYREIDPSGNSVEKSIDLDFTSPTADASGEIRFSFFFNNLLAHIGANIPDLPGYTRRIDSLSAGKRPFEIRLLSGTEDLFTYTRLQKSGGGLIQESPVFTTVENGLGLFSSRIIHTEARFPNSATTAAFDTSVATKFKNFQFH
jgi:hypothetical protein